mgnify:CR=1 FL=1
MLVTTRGEDRRGEAHQDEGYQLKKLVKISKRKIIFTTQECNKVQRKRTRTQGKSFHEATKEIT